MSSDAEREYAIKQAGIALEEAQREVERCTALYDESGLFSDMAALHLAVDQRDDARRYMEALIRGRSAEQVARLESERGLA